MKLPQYHFDKLVSIEYEVKGKTWRIIHGSHNKKAVYERSFELQQSFDDMTLLNEHQAHMHLEHRIRQLIW